MKRIEHIDSLKGFLIISVVMCHVAAFCLGIEDDTPSFLPILFEFRNPPFFFISGFFAYKVGVVWNRGHSLSTLKKKTQQLFVPTTIFLLVLLYIHPSFKGHTFLFDDIRNLWFHWFTYALFTFFIIYSITRYILYIIKCNSILEDFIIVGCGTLFYLLFSVQSIYDKLPISIEWKQGLGLSYWGFYLFFVLGTMAKKHYSIFQNLLNSRYFMTGCLILFFSFNIFNRPLILYHFNLFRITTYLTGIILVYEFFHKYHNNFPNHIKNFLQNIGEKTLDIYLIHYFFLPIGLYYKSGFLRDTPMPVIEFTITLSLSLIIIGLSILVSNIIRMNPLFAYIIFGEKK